jgi:carotenoid cleavage dioxygenase-like enzyme
MIFFAAVGPHLTWYRADMKTGRVVDSHIIDMGCPAIVHDYIVSENYAIFLISPTQFRLEEIMRDRASVLWDEAAVPDGSRFAVLDRRTKQVTWYDTGLMVAPTYFFNAFETPQAILVDVRIISRLGNPADDLDNPASSHTWFPLAITWRFELNPSNRRR